MTMNTPTVKQLSSRHAECLRNLSSTEVADTVLRARAALAFEATETAGAAA